MQMSFGSIEMSQRIRKDSTLSKVNLFINWEALRPQLTGLYKRESSHAGGQEPFDSLVMFKAILLGQWHSLSDPKLEEALHVRIDFMQFCGLTMSDTVPDETTLCRFRNRLIHANKFDQLLASINAQLQQQSLMIKAATGAVIDATLIESAARPNKTITVETDQDGQAITFDDGSSPGISCTEETSVDGDAAWVKKGKKSHYGYRSYVTVEETEGYVCGVHTAPANESETTHFIPAIDKAHITPTRVYADKGYASAKNRSHLRQGKIKSAIMHKGQRNKPLSKRQLKANKLISRRRYIIEQCFGTAKRLFGMARASYISTTKVNAQVIMKSICMNLLKAANKILISDVAKGVVRPQLG
jgi:IS5 family transposase